MKEIERLQLSELFIECRRRFEVIDKEQDFVNPMHRAQMSEGRKRLQQFENIIKSEYSVKPHKFQQGFINQATIALAPIILGDDWAKEGPKLMKERGWTHISMMVAAKTARRFGKSYAVGMVCIAFMRVGMILFDRANGSIVGHGWHNASYFLNRSSCVAQLARHLPQVCPRDWTWPLHCTL